jgi:hypothetical protein
MCLGESDGFRKATAPYIKSGQKAGPMPTSEPSQSSPAGIQSDRAKRVRQYRSGFASTLKTGALGVQGDSKKTKLGQ